MSNLWTAVKQIRSEKRFKNAPAPLDALAARVRQLTSDLNLLRRALKDDKQLCTCINNIISHNSKLTPDVDRVHKWSERLVGPFIVYIECYTQSQRPESLSSLLKAPFTFLPEVKELLVELERFTSKDCGVGAISALLTVCRRMLTLHSNSEASNDFEFNAVRSFTSGCGVSAAFNPLDIVERALFDMSVDGDQEIIAELLLLKSHGTKSLAICGVRESGARFLMYPPFKGREFTVKAHSQSMSLEKNDRSITLSAAPYILDHWCPIIGELFTTPQQQREEPREELNGLGIAFTGDIHYDIRNAEEKFGDEFQDFDESFEKSTVTPSQSLNALKRISVGMPMDFSEDLAKILRNIEEEDGEGTPNFSNAKPKVPSKPSEPSEPARFRTLANNTSASVPVALPAPSAPFARNPSRPVSNGSGSNGSNGSTGSPASFFTVGSEFANAGGSQKSTPASSVDSPRTLDEAEALRRRISLRISQRENENIKERFRGTPLSTHTQDSVASLSSIVLSDASSVDRCVISLAKTDSLRDSVEHSERSSSVGSASTNSRQPPNIPAPVFAQATKHTAERATVVRVSMPKRINFTADVQNESTSNDLCEVPLSPVIAPQAPVAAKKNIGNPEFSNSQPDLAIPRDSHAPQAPRLVMSMYSPKVRPQNVARSHSDENNNNTLTQDLQTSLEAVPSAQPNIWFTEDPPKSSKVKAIAKFFKKKPKTPKSDASPYAQLSNNSSSTVATDVETLKEPKESVITSAVASAVGFQKVTSAPQVVEVSPEPVTEAVVPEAIPEPAIPEQAIPEPTVPAPAPPAVAVTTSKLPVSSSITSIRSFSSSDSDLSNKLNSRASTIFFRNGLNDNSRDLFKLPPAKGTDPTAICIDSRSSTVASTSNPKAISASSSVATCQSFASSLQSRGTVSTANTSVGSTKAWAEFMNGVNSNVARQNEQREKVEEDRGREAKLQRKAEELQKLEEEVQKKKQAIEEASQRVSELNLSTLDPGNNNVNRGVPLLRQLYDEKEEVLAAPQSNVSHLQMYRHPTQVSSAPLLKTSSIAPLVIKKPGASVAFSEPSTPTSPANVTFSGQMWVSKWTVNRWVPLSQAELQVEIRVTAERDLVVITMPGSSRPIKLTYSEGSDVRCSNAHDVELRVKEDVYMFRCRSTHRCKKFHNSIQALSIDPENPQTFIRRPKDADSTSGSSSSSGGSASSAPRYGAPPKLAQSVNTRLRSSVHPIIEE